MLNKNLSRTLFTIMIVATAALAQTAKHPLKLDDLTRFRKRRRSAVRAGRTVGRLYRFDDRCQGRQGQLAYLDGRL